MLLREDGWFDDPARHTFASYCKSGARSQLESSLALGGGMDTNIAHRENEFLPKINEVLERTPDPKSNGTLRQPIPKRIIQTDKSAPRSIRNQAMVSHLRLLHPDYEYLFFDDAKVDTFITYECPQYRSVFDSFRFRIQKYDFFRYLAIHRYGGFYFDIDVLLASCLSRLLGYGCVFPFEGLTLSHFLRTRYNMDWEIGNYAFGATPGHPFLNAIIENCVRAQKDPAWGAIPMPRFLPLSKSEHYVLFTTGPGLISRTLAENAALAKMVKILFPDDVCDRNNWHCFGDLGIHLMDSSWRPKNGRLRRRLKTELETWKWRALLKQSARAGKMRHQAFSEAV